MGGTKGERGCSGKGFGFGAAKAKSKHREGVDGEGGAEYGDAALRVCHFGSGGGGGDYGDSQGGKGGGIVIVDCRGVLLMAEGARIAANGGEGRNDSDGCGSGGSVFVKCHSVQMESG